MSSPRRVELLDLLRGAVIVWMALDHTRDFFQPAGTNPENLDTTSVALFATRWITHLCAPTFVFLAGVGMGMQVQRKGPKPELMAFFAKRGLWLMALEVTWVSWSWFFALAPTHLGVLWGIGGAMVLAAPFAKLSARWQAVLGGLTLLALTVVQPAKVGFFSALVRPFSFEVADHQVISVYVIIPWWTVMMLGMAAARLFDSDERRTELRRIGLGLLVAFVGLRALNLADPAPWSAHERGPVVTALSFLRVSKYPPSMAYLAATLGTSFVMGSFLLHLPERVRGVLRTFGRVPLFYYLLHLPFLHLLGTVYATVVYDAERIPSSAPLSLPLIYGAWLLATAVLYWPCRAYDHRKSTRRAPWMRYL